MSYAVNELGDWFGIIALTVLVYDETGSAIATAGLFLGTRLLPALIAPVIVARAERPAPRVALSVIYAAEAVTFVGLAMLATNFTLTGVIVLATIDGALALSGRSLIRAVTASLLAPSGELRAGNAILNIAFTGGTAIGPGLAGVIIGGATIGAISVGGIGIQASLLLNAGSFLLIAGILATTRKLPRAEPDQAGVMDRLRAGLAYIGSRRPLHLLLSAQGAAFLFFGAVIPVEVIYAKETLSAGDAGYGLLLTSWGVGMVLGSATFAATRRMSLGILLLVSTAAIGIAYLGMSAAPTLGIACLWAIPGGIGNGVQWVSLVSAIQELTAERMQARVMSVLESIGAVMPGIGYFVGGLIATGHGPRATFVFAGAGILLVLALATPMLWQTMTSWRSRIDDAS